MKNLAGCLKSSLVVASLLLVLPSAAFSQNMGLDMPTFESFDLNNDGVLTQSEMNEARELRVKERKESGKMLRNSKNHYEFSRIDANEDGVVDKKEFLNHQTRKKR